RRKQFMCAERQCTMALACRDTALVCCFLHFNHAPDTVSDKCIREGKRNDSERRCPRKREQAHTSGRGHEIDEPERKKRAEPQEQHVAERIGAEIMCKCLRTRADLAQEVLAKRASCNKKNADRPQGRAGDRSSASQKRAEQNATDQCKKGADRQGG